MNNHFIKQILVCMTQQYIAILFWYIWLYLLYPPFISSELLTSIVLFIFHACYLSNKAIVPRAKRGLDDLKPFLRHDVTSRSLYIRRNIRNDTILRLVGGKIFLHAGKFVRFPYEVIFFSIEIILEINVIYNFIFLFI